MKFGEYLNSNKSPEWDEYYLNYDELKNLIKELEQIASRSLPTNQPTMEKISLAKAGSNKPQRPRSGSLDNQERFFVVLEQNMKKIETFTNLKVKEIRTSITDVENEIDRIGRPNLKPEELTNFKINLEKAGEKFLRLEKFVNLNFTGFHKILKKHDKRLPNPCKAFYMARLHEQSWVRGDYSDVIVSLSRAFGTLRGDEEAEQKDTEKQAFVRSTRKYWVHIEDVSHVKYIILQHLPVFLQKSMGGDSDAQLVNSVYLDNTQMELYHGRLDKTPGAIALRMRWYGSKNPELVFVERKTHREAWTGEVSVKERFTVPESQVLNLLHGKYDLAAEEAKMRSKGKGEAEIDEWKELAQEVSQAINSKMLIPTVRTQYMRTAFQIPFDATVRISLDTNLCMIHERTPEQMRGTRWYRDPEIAVSKSEITRFPHAVLEVKLQLEDESSTPPWVTELIHSGMLMEVHKFSKFIHGCAVLFPEDVRAFPYWIDDPTLRDSIEQSEAAEILQDSQGANEVYPHLLPHDADGQIKAIPAKKVNVAMIHASSPRVKAAENGSSEVLSSYQNETGTEVVSALPSQTAVRAGAKTTDDLSASRSRRSAESSQMYDIHSASAGRWNDPDCLGGYCEWASAMEVDHVTQQKVEPKLFLANERTFIKWLEMAVVMSSISTGVLAFTSTHSDAQFFAMAFLPLSLLFIAYALWTFNWRNEMIRTRDTNRWDDPLGPVVLTVGLIGALTVLFAIKVMDFLEKEF